MDSRSDFDIPMLGDFAINQWAVTNSACMGHHNWVNEEVNATGYRRWVERDTIDKTGTHQQWSPGTTYDAVAFELLFLETGPPYIWAPSPRASF